MDNKSHEKTFEVIKESLDGFKDIGQVKFYALDPNDTQIIMSGVRFDEEIGVWIDVDDGMEYSENWDHAFTQYAAKILFKHNITCRFAIFGREIKEHNLAYQVDIEKVIELLECYGYVVKRATDLDRQKAII